jgi:hypothetical protein
VTSERRGRWLGIFAVSFGVLAVSNFLKPLGMEGETTGFVFFGRRLAGTANLVAGPLFGVVLALYAWGVWNLRRVALPLSYAYAAYVAANLVSYARHESVADGPGGWPAYLGYAALAVGGSVACAVMLTWRKAELT